MGRRIRDIKMYMTKINFTKILKAMADFFARPPAMNNVISTEKKADERVEEVIPELTAKILYINSEIGLRLRSTPEILDDNKVALLEYGREVEKIDENDKWCKIKTGDLVGWVSEYYLSEENHFTEQSPIVKESIQDALPEFKIGVANYADDSNTKKVRQFIKDEFTGGKNGWDLQCTEYAQYKVLQQVNIIIQWPSDRPRHGGFWADIFTKHNMYKVLDNPKTGCTMSFTKGFKNPKAQETGHVAFVEKVFDDGSIRISEANWPPPGKYFERTLKPQEWKDKWGGRFVDYSS